ncbi:anti-sigma factor domain-containing protein [Cellulomonas hominis]|uniref:anti-sigma factor domain-containing protein n=1 Tax=Cellulomonas hominis TaxID=156981 RepID=UPI001BD09B91|nr:anti-sigma factor [Cellulomonas hominis]
MSSPGARSAAQLAADDALARVADGDLDAFTTLYDTLSPAVHGTALAVLRDPDHAAEVTQEVMVEIWRTAARWDARRGSARAWATTMAHRRAVDRVRSVQAQRNRDQAVLDADRAAVDSLIARDPDAAREARSLRETAAVLGAAVAVPAPDAVRDAVLELVARTEQERAGQDAAGQGAAGRAGQDGTVRGGASGASGADSAARPHVAAPHAVGPQPGGAHPGPSTVGPPSRPADRSPATRPAGRPAARRRRTWRTVVATLAVLVAVAVPSTFAWRESQRAADAQARADRLTELLAEPGARIAAAEVTTGGTAVAVVTADAALVTATGVDDPGADRVYQLWVMRDGVPVPDATTTVSDGALEIRTDAFRTGDALALTVEPTGGSDAPTSEPVVVLAPA